MKTLPWNSLRNPPCMNFARLVSDIARSTCFLGAMTSHLLIILGVSCALLGATFGCPQGAFQDPDDSDYCFTVHKELQPWGTALSVCDSEGGKLVSVHDSRTNRFLKKLGEKWMDDSFMWIGANNYIVGGSTWSWQDGTPFDFTRWGRGEAVLRT